LESSYGWGELAFGDRARNEPEEGEELPIKKTGETTATYTAPPAPELEPPSDEALCGAVALGDETAFDLLVERYRERTYRLAWSLLRNGEDARDASQEAFIRLYRTAGRFEGRSRFSTWFYRILVNLCLDHRRRARWWRRLMAGAPDDAEELPAADARPDPDREQLARRLWDAVDELSPQQRAVVVLQVQEELPTTEVAAILGCSEATVRVHMHRALTALRGTLGATKE
jgi:RNA polymerase sigma-70 factor (ECF subfamily)